MAFLAWKPRFCVNAYNFLKAVPKKTEKTDFKFDFGEGHALYRQNIFGAGILVRHTFAKCFMDLFL